MHVVCSGLDHFELHLAGDFFLKHIEPEPVDFTVVRDVPVHSREGALENSNNLIEIPFFRVHAVQLMQKIVPNIESEHYKVINVILQIKRMRKLLFYRFALKFKILTQQIYIHDLHLIIARRAFGSTVNDLVIIAHFFSENNTVRQM
jgi:hypothetical protein